MDKYRVLCLHGYRQDGAKLRGRIAAFRRMLRSSFEFVFVDAPFVVPYEPTNEDHAASEENGDDVRQFKWWDFELDEATGQHKLSRVDEAVEYLAEFVRKEGPFDGIFGFSQGGMMASLVLQRQLASEAESPFSFKFGIFVSAAGCGDPKFALDQKVNLPTLHIMGETDAVVAVEKSRALLDVYVDPKVHVHSGGHYIPTNKEPKDALRAFVKQLKAAGGNE